MTRADSDDFARTLECELAAKDAELLRVAHLAARVQKTIEDAHAATLAQLEEAHKELKESMNDAAEVAGNNIQLRRELEESQYAVEAVETKYALLQKSIADLSHPNIVMLRDQVESALQNETRYMEINCQLVKDLAAVTKERDAMKESAVVFQTMQELVWENSMEGDDAYEVEDVLRSQYKGIDKLRADLAAANDWKETLFFWGSTPQIVDSFIKGQQTRIHACQDLEKELAAARKDSARLDWLLHQYSFADGRTDAPRLTWGLSNAGRPTIDTAMSPASGTEEAK